MAFACRLLGSLLRTLAVLCEAGLHKLAPFYYMPGVLEIGPMLEASINKRVFESLGADLQEIVRRASLASAFETYADFTYHNAVNYELLLREGVQMRTFPADVIKAKADTSEKLLREIAEQSAFNRRVYDSFMGYRQAAGRYPKSPTSPSTRSAVRCWGSP